MIGGLDSKIEEIKKSINLSLESFTIAEKKLNEATQSTKDLDSKIKEILEDAKIQADVVSKSMIEKNQNTIISKEKNSLERIKQIELATIQTIKSQASIKLDEILMNYFENMPSKTKTNILKNKIEELNNFQ
jgi:F0F1-type ATP synthase membrane subunit b/b'